MSMLCFQKLLHRPNVGHCDAPTAEELCASLGHMGALHALLATAQEQQLDFCDILEGNSSKNVGAVGDCSPPAASTSASEASESEFEPPSSADGALMKKCCCCSELEMRSPRISCKPGSSSGIDALATGATPRSGSATS